MRAGPTPRLAGMYVAGITALLSGVSVFVNSYGVHSVSSPALYTTAKNAVAAMVLGLAALVGWRIRQRSPGSAPANFVTSGPSDASRHGAGHWLGLTYVGIVGGGLAFVLFFNGLAASTPASAAFWRDTMVLWVVVLAVPILREKVQWWNVAAIALLVSGEIIVAGGVGQLAPTRGELYVLTSTVLWAIEVVVAKRLLREVSPATISLVRMAVGTLALVGYLWVNGSLSSLVALDAHQIAWVLATGLLLSGYVATWMTALARARALDVTSVLVASAVVTWLLQLMAGTAATTTATIGLVLIVAGAGLVVWAGAARALRSTRRGTVTR
ncbi:MAG: DMT family transporter [Acidimicrobiales bacterium]